MLYIALLRGINVGGHTVKMDQLRQLFSELGLANVRTYIQSGNVFFETLEQDRQALSRTIAQHLQQALGYEVPVILRSADEMEQIITLNPFQNLNVTADMRLCVMFSSDPIPEEIIAPLRSPKNDWELVHTTANEAFVVWYLIGGRPPSSLGILDKTLGKKATTRFFHTTAKILEAALKR